MAHTRRLKILSGNIQVEEYYKDKRSWFVANVEGLGYVLNLHGDSDGRLAIDDQTLAAVFEYNKIDLVHCCYPARVKANYPHLPIMYDTIDTQTCTNYWYDRRISKRGYGWIAFCSITQNELRTLKASNKIDWTKDEE